MISTFTEPLGWALLHFLWQGAAIGVLLRVFLWLARRSAPQVRYAAAGVALLLMLSAAAGTLWWQARGVEERAQRTEKTTGTEATPQVVQSTSSFESTQSFPSLPPPTAAPARIAEPPPSAAPATVPAPAAAERLRPLLPWLVSAWAAGVALFSLRLLNGWRTVRRWRASGSESVPAEWSARFARLCETLRLSRPVRLLSSATLAVPVVIGWLKPAVLVPAGLFAGLSAAQLEAILAHELAHIRRHDYLVNLLQSAVETVLFYHPAVWWVSAQLRKEREHCCDDIAASLHGDALTYARALTTLEELRAAPALTLSAAGGSLLQRIRRLAGLPQERAASAAWPLGILTLALVAAALAFTLLRTTAGEPPEPPEPAKQGADSIKDRQAIRIVPATGKDSFGDGPVVENILPLGPMPLSKHAQTNTLLDLWRAEYKNQEKLPAAPMLRLATQVRDYTAQNPGEPADKLERLLLELEMNQPWRWDSAQTMLDAVCDHAPALTDKLIGIEEKRQPGGVRPGSAEEDPFNIGGDRSLWDAEPRSPFSDGFTIGYARPVSEAGKDHPPNDHEKLSWGPAAANGLRAAWVLEPIRAHYAMGEILKCHVAFHNSGQEPITFDTDQWHQDDEWIVKNAAGGRVNALATRLTGFVPPQTFTLKPGEYAVVGAHGVGIGIGTGNYEEAYRAGRIGVEIPAKPGDALTCQWVVKLDRTAGRGPLPPGASPATLTTGEVRFTVVSADPGAMPGLGLAIEPGYYALAEGIRLQITRTTQGEPPTHTNTATIKWYAGNGQLGLKWPIELSPGLEIDPLVWQRGGTALWIVRDGVVRRIDYTNAADVKEKVFPKGESGDYGGATGDLLNNIKELAAATRRFQDEVKVAAPAAESTGEHKAGEVVINVGEDGTILSRGKTLTMEELGKELAEIARTDKKQAIIIRGDVKTPYARIIEVLDATHKAGLYHVSFASAQSAPPKSAPAGKKTIEQKDGTRTEVEQDEARGQMKSPPVEEAGPVSPTRPLSEKPADSKGIALTVLDATGKVPLKEFRVIAGVRAGSAGGKDTINWQPHTLRTGKDGGLVWPLERAYDEFALRVEADGFMPQVFSWLEKKKGPQDLVFQMVAQRVLIGSGSVLTPGGKPAAGATIAMAMVQREAVIEGGKLRHDGEVLPERASDRWRWPRIFKANEHGGFMLPAENDPTAALLVTHESGVREMSLKDFGQGMLPWTGGGPHPQVKLQPWARIEGKVQWGDKPGAGQKVSLTIHRDAYGYPGIVAQYEKTTAGADGSFVFEKVLPGRVQLSCPIVAEAGNKAGFTEINLDGRIAHLTLKPGANTAVIGGSGRKVTGRLTGREKWDGVTFHFHPTAPHIGMDGDDEIWKAWGEFQKSAEGALFFRSGLKVNADGTFEVPGVLPGDYQIFFKREGEDKYLASGKFSMECETGEKEAKDIGEFRAGP